MKKWTAAATLCISKGAPDPRRRIISIADIFTALTEDRPYRKGMAWQEALQIMEADVINGALDSDVFLVLRHHAETLHAIILQTLAPLHSERRL